VGHKIIGFGHDDLQGAHATSKALLDTLRRSLEFTTVIYGSCKEEQGDCGADGAKGTFLSMALDRLCYLNGRRVHEDERRKILQNSVLVYSDVDPAVTVHDFKKLDTRRATRFGYGTVVLKTCGGDQEVDAYCAPDAFVDYTQRLLRRRDNNVVYQMGESPTKLNEGGGGVIPVNLFTESPYGIYWGIVIGSPIGNSHGVNAQIHEGDLYATQKALEAMILRKDKPKSRSEFNVKRVRLERKLPRKRK
jgi:aspartyl aminopeptidase